MCGCGDANEVSKQQAVNQAAITAAGCFVKGCISDLMTTARTCSVPDCEPVLSVGACLFFGVCSNDQISAIVGLRVKGVAKRVAEKKMRLDLRDSAIQ